MDRAALTQGYRVARGMAPYPASVRAYGKPGGGESGGESGGQEEAPSDDAQPMTFGHAISLQLAACVMLEPPDTEQAWEHLRTAQRSGGRGALAEATGGVAAGAAAGALGSGAGSFHQPS